MLDITNEAPAAARNTAEDGHAEIRAEVRQIAADHGLSMKQIAQEAGIPYGTFTPWMGGTYPGDREKIAAKVETWLETSRSRSRTMSVLPSAPDFVMTQAADEMFAIMTFAQAAPDFGVIVGGAGIGKTTAIEAYRRQRSNVHIVTAEPCFSSPINLLNLIAQEVGALEGRSDRLSGAIRAKLRGSAGLVIIDEAQHLTSQALDQLRTTVLDRAQCGVVVVGNEAVYSRLQGQGEARSANFAQLYSRVGMRKSYPQAYTADICAIIGAWKIKDEATVRLLKAIARKPGAIRSMNKVIRAASMFASGEGQDLTADHVSRAWRQLSSEQIQA